MPGVQITLAAWAVAVMLVSGCSEQDWGKQSEQRMFRSTGKFTEGYKDGKRDARQSWTDIHAGWMWLWMTEEEYRKGYDQGWNDGRRIKKLKKQAPESGG